MTKEFEDISTPETFYDVIYKSKLLLLGDRNTGWGFRKVARSMEMNDMQNSKLYKLWSKAYLNLRRYSNEWTNIFTLANSTKDQKQKYVCGRVGSKFFDSQVNLEKYYETPNNNTTSYLDEYNCQAFNRFAMIYRTNQMTYDAGPKLSLYTKLILMLYGEYLLIENNDPVVFSETYIWQHGEMSYLWESFSNSLGSLVESGIYGYQQHYQEIINQQIALKHFLALTRFNRKWSWFSLVNKMVSKYTPLA